MPTLRRREVGTVLAIDDDLPSEVSADVIGYEQFPTTRFLGWVASSANVEIVGVDLPILSDPEVRPAVLKSLGDAARRGAPVWVAMLCPESDSAIRLSFELRHARPRFISELEENLWTLYRWQQETNALIAASPGDRPAQPVEVVLYSQRFGHPPLPPLAPHYVCGDIVLAAYSESEPGMPTFQAYGDSAMDAAYARYPYSHPAAGTLEMYRDLLHRHHVPLEKHVLDRVAVGLNSGGELAGVKFVRHEGVKYLAVLDRDHVAKLSTGSRVRVLHGLEDEIECWPSTADPTLAPVLDDLVAMKYGTAAAAQRYFLFRLDES